MGIYNSGWFKVNSGTYAYAALNCSSLIEWNNSTKQTEMTVSWALGIRVSSGGVSYNNNKNALVINNTTVGSYSWNVSGDTFNAIATGSYTVNVGTARTVSHGISWSFCGASGSGTLTDTHAGPDTYGCANPTDITSNSITVTAYMSGGSSEYWRYYLYDVNSGKTWIQSSPQAKASAQYTCDNLSANQTVKVALRVVDRQGLLCYQSSAAAEATTLGYSLISPQYEAYSCGSVVLFNFTRYDTSFTQKLNVWFDNESGTQTVLVASDKFNADSYSWDTSDYVSAIYEGNPTKTSVIVNASLETYSGDTLIGTSYTSVLLTIPDSIKPVITKMTVDDESAEVTNAYKIYVVRYLSKKKVSVTCSAGTGSSIKSVSITFGSTTYQGVLNGSVYEATFDNLSSAEVVVTVTDVRNREETQSITGLQYLEYDYPSITKLTAYRESQTSANGTCEYSATYSTVGDNTITSATLACSNGDVRTLSGSAGSVSGSETYTALAHNTSFTFTLSIQDAIWTGTASTTFTLAQGQPTIWLGEREVKIYENLNVNGLIRATNQQYWDGGAGFIPLIRDSDALMEIGSMLDFHNGLQDTSDFSYRLYTVGDQLYGWTNYSTGTNINSPIYNWQQLMDKIYPVGSIYMSMNNVSPASFFGGTWEQLTDRFLIGAGSSYSAGSTGGEATHTLTVNEMPAHNHNLRFNQTGSGSGSGVPWSAGTTIVGYDGSAVMPLGGGSAHNNMPPYLAVYMWKRTA